MWDEGEVSSQGAAEGEPAREQPQAELEDTMTPAFAIGHFPAQAGVANDLGAHTTHPGGG